MAELEPCPCCNGKSTCFAEDDGYRMRLGDNGGATTDGESEFRGVAGCEACGLGFEEWHDSDEPMFDGCIDPSEFEAILERHMAAKWNTRWERTCHDDGTTVFRCDACGAFAQRSAVMDCCATIPIRYCPNCGAKVVGK